MWAISHTASDANLRRKASSTPPQLAWLEVLETGLVELDAWHRRLIDDCNRLLDLIADRAPWIPVVAASMLLATRLMDHFRFEEEVMNRNGFPRRGAHAAEHRRIEAQLKALLAQIKAVDGLQDAHLEIPMAFKPLLVDVMVRLDLDYRSHLLHRSGR